MGGIDMGYREKWFNAHSPNFFGKYRCVKCGGWFTKEQIEIDHRIPKRDGGTDDLWNLQPMCRKCNRAKRDRQTGFETAGTLVRATVNGQLGTALGGMAKQGIKDALGIKYRRR